MTKSVDWEYNTTPCISYYDLLDLISFYNINLSLFYSMLCGKAEVSDELSILYYGKI